MADFTQLNKKGMGGFWIESSLPEDRLSLHISEIPAGARPHPPHSHAGVEAFYVFEGSGVVELADGSAIPVGPNQAVTVDASRVHGLVNTGSVPMKYLVVIAKP